MQSREKSALFKLAELAGEKVVSELQFSFTFFLPGCDYQFISTNLETVIKQECITDLTSLPLTTTQSNILEQIDLNKFANKLAGRLMHYEVFDIIIGVGFITSGLTKVYFNAVSVNVKKFVKDAINPFNLVNNITHQGGNNHDRGAATYDTLMQQATRSKKISSLLGEQLLLSATPLQTLHLREELLAKENLFVSLLREKKFFRQIISKRPDDFTSYTNHLFNLSCCADLLVILFKKPYVNIEMPAQDPIPALTYDVAQHVMGFFSPKERNRLAYALSLINKEMKSAKEDEVNKLKQVYR